MLLITQCCTEDLDTIKTAHIHSFMLFYSPFPCEKAMACYKLGFEEFIIMNKMFVQIFVLLNNLMCYVVLCSRVYLYKLN